MRFETFRSRNQVSLVFWYALVTGVIRFIRMTSTEFRLQTTTQKCLMYLRVVYKQTLTRLHYSILTLYTVLIEKTIQRRLRIETLF